MSLSVTLKTSVKIGNIFVKSHSIVKILSLKRKTFNRLYT